jgi:hypothetical protein
MNVQVFLHTVNDGIWNVKEYPITFIEPTFVKRYKLGYLEVYRDILGTKGKRRVSKTRCITPKSCLTMRLTLCKTSLYAARTWYD